MSQHKTKKITGRQTTRNHRRKKKSRTTCVTRCLQARVCVHVHNDGENKMKMTSMYTNTHLTAKEEEEETGKDGTHSVVVM
jgi:hypothetical protein